MNRLTLLTQDPKQKLKANLPDGSRVELTFRYLEQQQGWVFDLLWGTFELKGRRLVVGPNLLRQFKNIIPFGIACFSKDGYEPALQNDFSGGRVSVYILDSDDVVAAETGIAAYV